MPDQLIKVGDAVITSEIANTLCQMQRDDNADLDGMISDIDNLKRFLIHLNGSDEEPSVILNHLATIQNLEDTLAGFKLTNKTQSHE